MKYLYIILLASFITACGDSASDLSVEEYIEENNLMTRELDSGVHIMIDNPGNDTKPKISDKVVVNYTGRLTNGTQFDSNDNIEFELAGLIKGWQIGLQEIGEGGSCTLIVPPAAGYGSNAVGSIPGNSVLVFDMDLLEVK